MNRPEPGDYIDIHTHGGKPAAGIFIIENLVAGEDIFPGDVPGVAFSFGIHPWILNDDNHEQLISLVKESVVNSNLIAVGEAGFDKIRGPSLNLQMKLFEEQVIISEEHRKPVIIHCVKAWDELLASYKRLKPAMPWIIHGFRGSVELASQLLSKGMYLSIWFDFALRPESSKLLGSLPADKIFLETDGAAADIRQIYNKVSDDIGVSPDELKSIIMVNFRTVFGQ